MDINQYLEYIQKNEKNGELWSTKTHKLDRQVRLARSILETLDQKLYDQLITQAEYSRLQTNGRKINGKSLRRLEGKIRQLRDNKRREKQERDAEARRRWQEQEKPFERFSVLAQSLSQQNKLEIIERFSIDQLQEFQRKLLVSDLTSTLKAYPDDHVDNVLRFLASAITTKV